MQACNKCTRADLTIANKDKKFLKNKMDDLASVFPGTSSFAFYMVDKTDDDVKILYKYAVNKNDEIDKLTTQKCDTIFKSAEMIGKTSIYHRIFS